MGKVKRSAHRERRVFRKKVRAGSDGREAFRKKASYKRTGKKLPKPGKVAPEEKKKGKRAELEMPSGRAPAQDAAELTTLKKVAFRQSTTMTNAPQTWVATGNGAPPGGVKTAHQLKGLSTIVRGRQCCGLQRSQRRWAPQGFR